MTTTVKLKETAATAFIVINAMKYILEENGFELVHEKLSWDDIDKNGEDVNKGYCLAYLVERTINNLAPIMNDQEYALIPCEQSEEVLNVHQIISDLFRSKENVITFSSGESYSLQEHDVWNFNRNFNNFFIREN